MPPNQIYSNFGLLFDNWTGIALPRVFRVRVFCVFSMVKSALTTIILL